MALPRDYLVGLCSLLAKVVARLIQASLCPCAILELLVYGERVYLTDSSSVVVSFWRGGCSTKKMGVNSNRNPTSHPRLSDTLTHH